MSLRAHVYFCPGLSKQQPTTTVVNGVRVVQFPRNEETKITKQPKAAKRAFGPVFIFVQTMTDISPEQFIDLSENKPIEDRREGASAGAPHEDSPQAVAHDQSSPPPGFEIKATRVKDLTTEERLRLVSDAKNGVENKYFKVHFTKNGSSRITKRKQPVEQTAERVIKQYTPSLTTEQLLMEHVIGLESQLATLRQKHKKLKKSYKSMYQDVYVDDEDAYDARAPPSEEVVQSNSSSTTPTTNALNDMQDNMVNNNECLHGVQQAPSSPGFAQQQNIFGKNKSNGWRARIAANMY